jgi:hypothetical protein
VYFTSYARLDAKGTKLGRVFERIKDRVRSALGVGHPDDIAAIAFGDTYSVETGEDWQRQLAAAVHQARVLVCFVSPTYCNSEWCAKEFAVFRRRLEHFEQLDGQRASGAPPRKLRAIIPVLWELGTMPSAIGKYQYDNHRFPPSYATMGLRALCALKETRDAAEKTIGVIADAIHEAAKAGLPALEPCLDFQLLPRSFDNPGPYGIALVALTARGPQLPIGFGDTLAKAVDRVADQLKVPWRELPVDAGLAARVDAAVIERQVVVVVTDDTSAAAQPFAGYLGQLQAAAAPLAVLVGTRAMVSDDAAARAQLAGLAAAGSHTTAGSHAIESFALGNAALLESRLAALVIKRRAALVAADPLVKVDDLALTDDADRAGIAISSRPGLRGPGAPP